MSYNRTYLSSCSKVKDEADIPGNFTSVRGEYFVPSMNRTGFYKLNSSFENNPDLRELLASMILKQINVPSADVLLVYDDIDQENGCISMSILRDGEYFLEDGLFEQVDIPENLQSLQGLERFIETDLHRCASKYNFTPELLAERKRFLIEYVFVSAFLGNDDIKTGNCQLIYNQNTGVIRNPEYYDMGMSFEGPATVSQGRRPRYFFNTQEDIDVLQELYEKYPSEIADISKRIEQGLSKPYIETLLNNEAFEDWELETRTKILNHLGRKIAYISKQNELLYGVTHSEDSFLTSTEEIGSVTQETSISLIDKAKVFLQSLKERMLGVRNR